VAATGADPASIMTPPAIQASIEPEPRLVPLYAEAYDRYRRLYPLSEAARG
jgi:xylulokinase